MTILDEIFAHKQAEVQQRKLSRPLSQLQDELHSAPAALDFVAALRRSAAGSQVESKSRYPALIAEVKCASPSRGLLVKDFNPPRLARIYAENGAAAISVLTDERYFQGSLDHLRQIRALGLGLPLLRKDFICDPYQVYEARAAGADAVLLIAAYLDLSQLRDLYALALSLGLSVLVEVHDFTELEVALQVSPTLVGINNRDLRNFSVNLETTLGMRSHVPPEICLVAESGIHSPGDVERLAQVGVDAILVGEGLVTAADTAAQVRLLAGSKPNQRAESI